MEVIISYAGIKFIWQVRYNTYATHLQLPKQHAILPCHKDSRPSLAIMFLMNDLMRALKC